jgi:hypothetical protein
MNLHIDLYAQNAENVYWTSNEDRHFYGELHSAIVYNAGSNVLLFTVSPKQKQTQKGSSNRPSNHKEVVLLLMSIRMQVTVKQRVRLSSGLHAKFNFKLTKLLCLLAYVH